MKKFCSFSMNGIQVIHQDPISGEIMERESESMGSDDIMTKPIGMRAFSVLFTIFLVSIAFMPVVSAQSIEDGTNGLATYSDITDQQWDESSDSGANLTENSTAKGPRVFPVVAGIFAIEIPTWVAALLGLTGVSTIAVVHYKDNTLAFVDSVENYIPIHNIIAINYIIFILDVLHLHSNPDGYKHASSRPEGGLQWNSQNAVTSKPDPCERGVPESSRDYVTRDNKLLTRFYYNAKGILEITWDYDSPHKGRFPHAHRWFLQFDKDGNCIRDTIKDRRPGVIFNEDGTEILDYIPK